MFHNCGLFSAPYITYLHEKIYHREKNAIQGKCTHIIITTLTMTGFNSQIVHLFRLSLPYIPRPIHFKLENVLTLSCLANVFRIPGRIFYRTAEMYVTMCL